MATAQSRVLSRKAAVAKGAIMITLAPKLAQDAKKIDLDSVLQGVTQKNFKDKKASILEGLTAACKGKLAQDADISDVVQLLDNLDDVEEMEGADEAEPGLMHKPEGEDEDDKEKPEPRKWLEGKLSAEDMATYDSMCAPKEAHDEDEDEAEKKEEMEKKKMSGDVDAGALKAGGQEPMNKAAMDAAIATATKRAAEDATKAVLSQQKAVREAERFVQPYIGQVNVTMDSAEAIYKLALDSLKVDLTDVPASAFKAVLRTIPHPGKKREETPVFAQDAAAASTFTKMFPDAVKIGSLG